MKTWVVLPAYNEEAALPPLIESLAETLNEAAVAYAILVVDDGSSDETASVAGSYSDRLPVTVIPHERNSGLAAALRTGLNAACALAADDDVIVTLDADNTHPPAHIPGMLALISAGYDVVIASRYQSGAEQSGLSALRTLMSSGAGMLFRLLLPIPGVRDYTCGYRAYRASAIKFMLSEYGPGEGGFISERGFSCMADVLLKMRAHGFGFAEVPLTLRYDLKEGASKMRVARTAYLTLRLIFKRLIFGVRHA